MTFSRPLAAGLVLGALALPLGAQASTLHTLISNDIRGLEPGSSPDTNSGAVRQNIYEGLVAWTAGGAVEPMLAKSWTTQDDGRTYVFTLRDGVTFHNGAPLTSKQVVWTWDQFLNGKNAWACRSTFTSDRLNVQKVEAVDDMHVAFHLEKPSPVLLSAMARSDCDSTGIADPASMDAEGNWTGAIGTGPFMLKEWKKGQDIVLAKFPGYAPIDTPADGLAGKKQALVDEVRIDVVPDNSSVKAALQNGQLDLWFTANPEISSELGKNPDLTVESAAAASVFALPFRSDQPVTKNPLIRQAIAAAIDPTVMNDALAAGTATPSESLVPVTSEFYPAIKDLIPGYDPDRAKALLKQAGYNGEKITILTNKNYQMMSDSAVLAQSMMQKVGINADIEVVEFPAQYDRYYAGNYQMTVWNVTPYLDPLFIFDRFIGTPDVKDKVWTTPEAQDLLNRLFAATDDAQKQDIVVQLQKLYNQQMPMAIWASRSGTVVYSKRVHGFSEWAGQKPRFWNVSVDD